MEIAILLLLLNVKIILRRRPMRKLAKSAVLMEQAFCPSKLPQSANASQSWPKTIRTLPVSFGPQAQTASARETTVGAPWTGLSWKRKCFGLQTTHLRTRATVFLSKRIHWLQVIRCKVLAAMWRKDSFVRYAHILFLCNFHVPCPLGETSLIKWFLNNSFSKRFANLVQLLKQSKRSVSLCWNLQMVW